MEYVVCKWGDQPFAVASLEVVELLRMVKITHLPTESVLMDGLINYHGHLIPVLDAQRLFKSPALPFGTDSLLIVVEVHHQRSAILAHELVSFMQVDSQKMASYEGLGQEFFNAAYHSGSDIVPILNLERLYQDTLQTLRAIAALES